MIGLAIAYAWAATHSPNADWAELLLAVAAAYAIARLIHAETIPGDRQFWITRPYRWSSLLSAKLLGVLVFVNVPIFAARAYVLVATGFPIHTTLVTLIWSQFLMYIGACLPIAALAAVTSGIVPFTFMGLILLAAGFGIEGNISPPSASAVRLMLTSTQWVWNSIAVLTLTAFAVPVLYMQYRRRRTLLSRGVIFCVGAVGAAAYVYVPWPVAAAMQTSLSSRGFDHRALRVSLKPDAKRFFPMGRLRGNGVQVDLPLAVHGVPEDAEVIPDAVSLTFQTANGNAWATGPYDFPALARQSSAGGVAILNANVVMPRAFFHEATNQPVKIIGSLYLSIFGNPQRTTIPIQNQPVDVSNGLQCGIEIFQQFSCRSALRWPYRLVYAEFEDSGLRPFRQFVSYSPFPAGLSFTTVESRQVSAPRGERQVSIIVKEPLANLRHVFEIDEFPLRAFAP